MDDRNNTLSYILNLEDIYDNRIYEFGFRGKAEYLPSEKAFGAPIWTYPYMFKRMDNFGDREETLGQRLVRWCVDNNCTQGDDSKLYVDVSKLHGYINAYAARWGYSFSLYTIRCYLHQKFSPKIDRATMIANALNVPVAWLMGYGPSKIPQSISPVMIDAYNARRAEIRAVRVKNMEKARAAKKAKRTVIAA